MQVDEAIWRLGGATSRAQLLQLVPRSQVDRALAEGHLVRLARGRYAAPHAQDALRLAAGLTATVSHRSAAAFHGWGLKTEPEAVDVIVPRNRRVSTERREGATVHWVDLPLTERSRPVTSPLRTIHDCLRSLPFDEGLAVADSALRSGCISRADLRRAAEAARGPGAAVARAVAAAADRRAANPFESVLRSLALQVPGLEVEPQVVVIDRPKPRVIPDLVDRRRRLIIEAESFEFHGRREQLRRDTRRLNRLVLAGWTVIRFSWEDVMHHPDYVLDVLSRAVALCPVVAEHAEQRVGLGPAA